MFNDKISLEVIELTVYGISDIRDFMNKLLKSDLFDDFEVRKITVNTFALFEISCFDSPEDNFSYRTWKELRPYVFFVIKGSELPGSIKIILSASSLLREKLSAEASAFFLNIHYENNSLTCIPGSSQKHFSLDKTPEIAWNEYIKDFFDQNKILSTQLD